MPTVEHILQALTQVIDPELNGNIVELGMVRDVQIDDGVVSVTLALTIMGCPLRNYLKDQTQKAALVVPGVSEAIVELTAMTDDERKSLQQRLVAEKRQPKEGLTDQERQQLRERMPPALGLNRAGRMLAVMSGKGGVGKSSVTALLAVALHRQGYAVGILDADITGPSIPRLFGISGPVQSIPLGILPVETPTGIKVMSTNLMLPEEDMALVWRGPVMSSAIRQFWKDVLWGRLDYLLVDLPPGTSDATLTAMEALPLDGVLMVTTPQALSAMVVRKTVHMAQTLAIPVLGIVENMTGYICPETGIQHEIFGPSHAQNVADLANAPILGRLPIDPALARFADHGEIEDYEHPAFTDLAASLVTVLPPCELELATT